jgi:hypothetical protein
LTPTAVPSFDLEARQLDEKFDHELISSKDELAQIRLAQDEKQREKRFFSSGFAASTVLTSYSFIGVTVTNTVILDPMGAAVYLPAGFVICNLAG